MQNFIVFALFFILAGITSYSAMQLSNASEKFEQFSKLPPILIGAILAVATSLPEFATSLTSNLILHQPTTTAANPIGSNMFNVMILALMNIIFYKKTVNYYLKNNNNVFNTIVIIMYLLTFTVALTPTTSPAYQYMYIGNVNIITIIIILLYFLGLKLSKDMDQEEQTHENNPQELRKAIIRFVIFSVVVIVSSYFLSLVADKIIAITGLASGFVGAVFLGIATSLPELISAFLLCKHGSYNIAASNVIGSNLFNFIIVAINDVVSKQPLWSQVDSSVYPLYFYGFVLSCIVFFMISFKTKNKVLNLLLPILSIGTYIYYLISNG